MPGPLGSVSLRLSIGTILMSLGLMVTRVVERWTRGKGFRQATSFCGQVGAALVVVEGPMLVTPL